MRILFTYSCRRQTCPTRITFTRIYRIASRRDPRRVLCFCERNTSDENFSKINISIEIDNSCRYQTIMDRSFFFIQARFVLEKKKKESYVSTILIKLEQFTWRPCKCIPALYPRLAVQSMVQIRGNYYAFRDSG